MLDKILKTFFTEKKQRKKTAIITVVRRSCLFNENDLIKVKQAENANTLTCLSKYFKDIKGLNIKERELAKQRSR